MPHNNLAQSQQGDGGHIPTVQGYGQLTVVGPSARVEAFKMEGSTPTTPRSPRTPRSKNKRRCFLPISEFGLQNFGIFTPREKRLRRLPSAQVHNDEAPWYRHCAPFYYCCSKTEFTTTTNMVNLDLSQIFRAAVFDKNDMSIDKTISATYDVSASRREHHHVV